MFDIQDYLHNLIRIPTLTNKKRNQRMIKDKTLYAYL